MMRICRPSLRMALALLCLAVASPALARAGSGSSRGLVDGSEFRELAEGDAEVVEVNLGPSMLQALVGGQKAELGSLLRGIRSIQAYIVNLEGHRDRIDRALRLTTDLESKLRRQGWSPLVTVREGRSRLNVMALNDDDSIQGLVVLAVDPDEGQTVFVNIAGSLDLARLGELSAVIDVPGLDELGRGKKRSTSHDHDHDEELSSEEAE